MTKLVIFDLDNTLSESKSKISSSMTIAFNKLLEKKNIAIISGETFKKCDFQVLSELPKSARLDHLILLPQSGTQCFQNKKGEWQEIYKYDLNNDEKKCIYNAIEQVKDIEKSEISSKLITEDKGGQITYSPIGIDAPTEVKKIYDPDHHKRKKIVLELQKLLPDFKVSIGGRSSIDITKKGIDKSFGIIEILKLKNLKPNEVIFIGDSLFKEGNDAPVRKSGVKCIQIKSPKETEEIIKKMVEDLEKKSGKSTDLIAFFCMEYAMDNDSHTYAGGLGILAGDYLLEAADQNVPIIAFGLHYGSSVSGDISDHFSLITDDKGNMMTIDIPISNEIIKVKIWQNIFRESVRLMLFDTNLPENSEENRSISTRLYDSHFYIRLKQQMILGIGSVRLLKILNENPIIYHLNEGHTAFTALAIIAERNDQKDRIVATKHTILSDAGILIPKEDFNKYVKPYCEISKIDSNKIFEMGLYERDIDIFSTMKFLMNASIRKNGVSTIHTVFEKKKHPDSTLFPITNGVYRKRWQAEEWENPEDEMQDKDIWNIKNTLRSNLISFIKEKTGENMDPNVCTVVWARRFTAYKRPLLLFSDLDRLEKIVSNNKTPIQFIISGKAHPLDKLGQDTLWKIISWTKTSPFKGKIVYIPDYSIEIASDLIKGADVWLNTPERGKEGCGTSGIKAGLNGALQCSISDGWVDEVNWNGRGWIISEENPVSDMYNYLENDIPWLFYERNEEDLPLKWIKYMKSTMKMIEENYTTSRMIDDYLKKLYLI